MMASEYAETCRSINNIIRDNKLVVFLTSLHCTFMLHTQRGASTQEPFLFRLTVLSTLVLSNPSDLSQLANTEARIILLYSTREEARQILAEATRLKLTGK